MTVKIDNTEPKVFPAIGREGFWPQRRSDFCDRNWGPIDTCNRQAELPTGRRLVDPLGTVSAQQARHNLLVIDVGKLLPAMIADDEASAVILHRPRRREAAGV